MATALQPVAYYQKETILAGQVQNDRKNYTEEQAKQFVTDYLAGVEGNVDVVKSVSHIRISQFITKDYVPDTMITILGSPETIGVIIDHAEALIAARTPE
jgi:hypothetical protein